MSSVFFVFESRQTPDLEYNTITMQYNNNTIQFYFTMLATHNKSWFPGGACMEAPGFKGFSFQVIQHICRPNII